MARITIALPMEMENYRACRGMVLRRLMNEFGGATSWLARGHWRDADGFAVHEEVAIIESYTNADPTDVIVELAESVYSRSDEDEIMVTIDNQAAFYNGE